LNAVYLQTNDAEKNEVVAFRRDDDGTLAPLGSYVTGGRGTGTPHLASQSSIVVSGERLLVVNAGSDEVTLFAIAPDGLALLDRVASGGSMPTSIALRDSSVYVLNAGGEPNVTGFALGDSALTPTGDIRPLPGSDPAQIGFSPDGASLIVSDRANDALLELPVAGGEPMHHPSSGATPYGFDFTPDGTLVVTEAFGGTAGAAAASSYDQGLRPVSKSVASTRSEVCWAAVTKDGRYVFVTNFGDGSISSYAIGADGSLSLVEAVAGSTVLGEKGVRDEALSLDGRFLYTLDADARKVFAFAVRDDGRLDPVGDVDGLPATAAGLAAV
jgi:6-phosphogluconolactonase (cycloisomerase 2 family)